MVKETLQKDLEKALRYAGLLYTRLRTPHYGFRGVRYPADFVLWLEKGTFLIECKQRAKFPLVPSDIRQLPFMKEWAEASYTPQAGYFIIASVGDGYHVFTHHQVVRASTVHKGLKKEDAIISKNTLLELVQQLEKLEC